MARGVYFTAVRFDVLFRNGVFTPIFVRPKKRIIGRQGELNATQKWKKKIPGVPPMVSEPCLSELKLRNVATAL